MRAPDLGEQMRTLLKRDGLWKPNYTAIAAELGVTRQAVSEWSRGKGVSPTRVEQIRRLAPGARHEEAAAPSWARRLLLGQDELLRRAGVDPAEIEAQARAAVRAEQRTRARPMHGAAPGDR
jgi:transcriptional regulator with XRE-family HTH domain